MLHSSLLQLRKNGLGTAVQPKFLVIFLVSARFQSRAANAIIRRLLEKYFFFLKIELRFTISGFELAARARARALFGIC